MDHIKSFHIPYIEALRADGHEVLTMAKGKDADFNIEFVKKMLSFKNTACRRKIKKILKKEKFDVLILNTTLAAFHVRLSLPLKNRPKVVNFVHGYMFPARVKTVRDKIFLACEKLLRKKTDYVIVMNDEDMEIASTYKLSKNDAIMSLGMGASVSEPLVSSDTIRKYTMSEGKFVISFVGELSRAKNQRMLICALPEIQIAIPNAVLWLIGEGNARHELIALTEELNISNSVYFTGKQQNPCDYIRASDVYASASEKEGLPFNIMEALGCGKITVASNIKGHRDIIEDGKSGFLYAPGDITEFIEKIKDIHSGKLTVDPAVLVERYKTYSRENVFPKTYGVLKEIVSK